MKVKINNKSHKIKPASELTIKEYILLFDSIERETSNLELLIKYLSITLNLTYKNVADIDVGQDAIRRLVAFIGNIRGVQDIPESKKFYYKKTGKTLYQKSINWRTIGVRKLLEDRKTNNQLEQVVYLLAIYLSEDYDNEKIEEIYQELQDYNAIDVFGFVVFFFKKLLLGKNSGTSFLKMLRKKANTKMLKLLSKFRVKD